MQWFESQLWPHTSERRGLYDYDRRLKKSIERLLKSDISEKNKALELGSMSIYIINMV